MVFAAEQFIRKRFAAGLRFLPKALLLRSEKLPPYLLFLPYHISLLLKINRDRGSVRKRLPVSLQAIAL